MEFLRKLLLQTAQHLKGLSLSQRLAITSCVGLIVLAGVWLVQWGGSPELVPLLDQPMSAQELTGIQQRLDALGIAYKISGDVVLVPVEGRPRLLAQLSQGNLLPRDISIGFARLMEESSPWLSMKEQDWRRSVALGNELSQVLAKFDGVLDARVFIDKNQKRTIGQPPVNATASVFVKLAAGQELDRPRVHAMACFVANAVAGLDVYNVAVTEATSGRSYHVPKPEEGMAFDDLEDRQKKEGYFAQKIRDLLATIPGLLVAVHAELDTQSRHEQKSMFGKPVMTSDRSETVTEGRTAPGAGPGVVPNVGQDLTGGTAEKMEKSVTETEFDAQVDTTITTTESPRHGLKSLAASVNVPRSYLAHVYRQANPGKEPSDAELETASRDAILAKIKRQVVTALQTEPQDVEVDWFHDEARVALGPPTMQAGGDTDVMTYVRAYGGKAGLGVLALTSLVMMLMMVRKVGEGPVLPGEEPPKISVFSLRGKRSAAVTTAEELGPVGEAHTTEQVLEGKEVDEATLRTQQMIEQVVGMVKEDPQASVSILQRWIDTGQA